MSLRADKIAVPAYAKVNLFLDIVGVLPNGYHSLNNIMQQIDLHDTVTVSFKANDENTIEISCDNPDIPCDERNIAYKAAELFMKTADIKGKIFVQIEKHIPVMAGLGGSSTDGAAVLKALNTIHNGIFTRSQLEETGAKLGADVPFCLRGGSAVCKGIGEKMTDIQSLEHCSLVVVKPDFSCNTGEAYKLYDKKPTKSVGEPTETVRAMERGNLRAVGNKLYNVFETLYGDPRIEKIKSELLSLGACGAALSGSGSAVFGIFEDEKTAVNAVGKLSYPFVKVCGIIR